MRRSGGREREPPGLLPDLPRRRTEAQDEGGDRGARDHNRPDRTPTPEGDDDAFERVDAERVLGSERRRDTTGQGEQRRSSGRRCSDREPQDRPPPRRRDPAVGEQQEDRHEHDTQDAQFEPGGREPERQRAGVRAPARGSRSPGDRRGARRTPRPGTASRSGSSGGERRAITRPGCTQRRSRCEDGGRRRPDHVPFSSRAGPEQEHGTAERPDAHVRVPSDASRRRSWRDLGLAQGETDRDGRALARRGVDLERPSSASTRSIMICLPMPSAASRRRRSRVPRPERRRPTRPRRVEAHRAGSVRRRGGSRSGSPGGSRSRRRPRCRRRTAGRGTPVDARSWRSRPPCGCAPRGPARCPGRRAAAGRSRARGRAGLRASCSRPRPAGRGAPRRPGVRVDELVASRTRRPISMSRRSGPSRMSRSSPRRCASRAVTSRCRETWSCADCSASSSSADRQLVGQPDVVQRQPRLRARSSRRSLLARRERVVRRFRHAISPTGVPWYATGIVSATVVAPVRIGRPHDVASPPRQEHADARLRGADAERGGLGHLGQDPVDRQRAGDPFGEAGHHLVRSRRAARTPGGSPRAGPARARAGTPPRRPPSRRPTARRCARCPAQCPRPTTIAT